MKEARYAHLMGDEIPAGATGVPIERNAEATRTADAAEQSSHAIDVLAREVVELRAEVADLRAQFAAFRKQFD
jgi:uncharacterized protein YceH (UPF0502 family)